MLPSRSVHPFSPRRRGPLMRRAYGMIALAALTVLAGCKGLTDVDDPSNISSVVNGVPNSMSPP